jgi:ribosomal protein S18 acetylase RimI-like enzyme
MQIRINSISLVRPNDPDLITECRAFWDRTGKGVPFFFTVPESQWLPLMTSSTIGGIYTFSRSRLYCIKAQGKVKALCQIVFPDFDWDENGELTPARTMAVIRFIYFNPSNRNAGKDLLEFGLESISGYEKKQAFLQCVGSPLNAYHGKLHDSLTHVSDLLLETGFRINQSNRIYRSIISATGAEYQLPSKYSVKTTRGTGGDAFALILNRKTIGTANTIRVDEIILNPSSKTVYLSWIGIEKLHRRQGLGSALLRSITGYYRSQRYTGLILDTSIDNRPAQLFYTANGYSQCGVSHGFIYSFPPKP